MDKANHYERAAARYRARAAAGGPLAGLWRYCARRCDQHYREALAAAWSERTPAWVVSQPVREVRGGGWLNGH